MKHLKVILTIFILTGLFACEPPVTFNEPQPVDTGNLSMFSHRLQGQYVSLADNSILLIGDKIIQRIYDYDYAIHPNQLDSNSRLVGDTIMNLRTKDRTLIKRNGDSLITHIHYIDTLFHMNYDNVVRKLKGYYFLNTRYGKESWEVKKIQLSKGQLVMSGIVKKPDLETLKEITETTHDTLHSYKFTMTKKQFTKFIKKDSFNDKETFIRLNK